MDSANNIVSFIRKTDKKEETLLFVCNFAPVLHEKYVTGVPFEGKYKEIFNSEAKKFGGSGKGNPRVKTSREEECDGRDYSITIQVPPLSVCVFSCTPEKAAKSVQKTQKKTAAKKAGGNASAKTVKNAETAKTEEIAKRAENEKPAAKTVKKSGAKRGNAPVPDRKPADVIPLKKRTKK